MANIIESNGKSVEVPTVAKSNAALTTGIIGTSLAGLLAVGAGMLGNRRNTPPMPNMTVMSDEDLYLERKEAADYLELTRQHYQTKIDTDAAISNTFFKLYKGQRDMQDNLTAKIQDVDKKVDIISAIRPYQDALINAKLDYNALLSNYNLAQRTRRMIEGELVLPSAPVVTGYSSYGAGVSSSTSTESKS